MTLRPALKVNLDGACIDILFTDLSDTPIVDLVFGIHIIGYLEELACGQKRPITCLVELVFS